MNYDFSPFEQTFIDGFPDTAAAAVEGFEKAGSNLQPARSGLLGALRPLADAGFLRQGLSVAGEGGVSLAAQMAAAAVLAARSPAVALAAEVSARLFGRIIDAWGTAAQRTAFLGPVTDGQAIGTVALSESAMNVENDPLGTRGEPDGDAVVVNGVKSYAINAAVADWVAVVGQWEDRGAVFIVPTDIPGLVVSAPMPLLGLEGAAVSSLQFNDCRIRRDGVIGPLDLGDAVEGIRNWENMHLSTLALGMMQAAFDTARDHAKHHRSGGKPVIAYQAVGFKLSEMLTLCQTAQWLVFRSGWAVDTAQPDADTLVRCAKVFCSEALGQVSAKALQVMAGVGVTTANPAERAYRGAAYAQVAGMSNEIARVRIGDDAMGWR